MTVEEWLGKDNALGQDIWEKKYRYNNETFDEWLDRVSGGDEELRQLIKERKFLFGGRTLCGNIETVSNLFTKKLNKRFIQEVKNNGYGIINNYFGYKIYVIDEQDIGTIIACNEKDLIKNIQEKYGKDD